LENCFKANVHNLGTQIFVKHNVGCFDVTTNNAKEVYFVMKIENAMSNPQTFYFFQVGQSMLWSDLAPISYKEK
jgi:hypothetical protein